MIKTYSLQYVSQEIEQLYRGSQLTGLKYRRECLYASVSVYLILIIIKYHEYKNYMPQMFAGVGLALMLSCYFLMKKYLQYKEILIVTNILIMSAIVESLRIFGQEQNQWYYGQHSSILKLLIYLTGSSFIIQSCFFLLTQFASIYNIYSYDIQAVISQCMISIVLVILRYQYEMINRKHFLVNLSKVQYENILEDLLPSWVVIIKYNKLTGLLDIEKINKHMKEKFNLNTNEAFRDFLRKLVFQDLDNQNTQQYIKIEHEIIQEFKLKNEDHPVQKYLAILEDQAKTKTWKFRVTSVYFNTFQPQVLLLFEEIEKDKYDQYINAIEQRDKQQYYNAKLSLQQINHQLEMIKQYYHEILKHEYPTPVQQNLKQQLQLNYFLYNLNSNLFNLYQISYKQVKNDINILQMQQFITDLCLNLQIDYKKNKIEQQDWDIKNQILRTDKQKLISIIMNVVQFIKLLLSIIHGDNSIINQAQPLKKPITLSVKQSKNFENSLQFTISHPNLNIVNSTITELQNIKPFEQDDDKRNWKYRNYFDKITGINQTLQSMLNMYKKEISSFQMISVENSKSNNSQNQNIINNIQQLEYNTIGYIIAQYFVSRLGPYNKFTFKQTYFDSEIFNTTQFIGIQQTKIQFSIYKNYIKFKKEIASEQLNYFEHDIQISSEKLTNQQLLQNLDQLTRKTK